MYIYIYVYHIGIMQRLGFREYIIQELYGDFIFPDIPPYFLRHTERVQCP